MGAADGRMYERGVVLMPVVLAATAAATLYGPVLLGLVRQWLDDTSSSHGILLVAAAAFVVRRRWSALRALTPQPQNAGAFVLALAMLIYVAGTLTGDIFVLRVSLPIAIAACILFARGRATLRMTLAPLALVCIAIPLPAVIVTHLTLPLQLVASQVAAGVLELCRISVVREGNLLALEHITLEVAEACSGLRSLTSLVSVAAVCATMLSLSRPRGLLLITAAVPVAIVGNGFRVAATGILATWIGEAAVSGVLHDLTGYVAFLVMCAAIIAVHIIGTRTRRLVLARRTRPPSMWRHGAASLEPSGLLVSGGRAALTEEDLTHSPGIQAAKTAGVK